VGIKHGRRGRPGKKNQGGAILERAKGEKVCQNLRETESNKKGKRTEKKEKRGRSKRKPERGNDLKKKQSRRRAGGGTEKYTLLGIEGKVRIYNELIL